MHVVNKGWGAYKKPRKSADATVTNSEALPGADTAISANAPAGGAKSAVRLSARSPEAMPAASVEGRTPDNDDPTLDSRTTPPIYFGYEFAL
jgi:hypothetical protein